MSLSRSPRSNVRLLATGRLISVAGSSAAYTALNFTVWDRTHSPFIQALALLLTFGVAGLVGPFLGALGDRFDRRRVMIWSEAASAACFAAMALADSPAWLIGFAFCSAIAEQPFFSASRAAIPVLVEREEDISWANGVVTLGANAGIAVGPVAGGVLLAVFGDATWVFAINAVSFVISLLFTIAIRAPFQESRTGESTSSEHEGIGAGIVFLIRDPVLRRLSIAYLVLLLGWGIGMVADAPLAESFEAGEVGYGVLIAAWGIGSSLGAVVGRWMNGRTEAVWLVAAVAGTGVASIGIGLAPVFPLVLASLLAMGAADGVAVVAENGILQRRTPDAVRSRTTAAFEAVLSLGLAMSYLLAGPVLRVLSAQASYALGGLAVLITVPFLLSVPRMHRGVEPSPARAPAARS